MVLENILLCLTSVHWTDAGIVLLLFILFLLISDQLRNRKPRNYPPGPTPLPCVGNVFNLDAKQPHIHLTKVIYCPLTLWYCSFRGHTWVVQKVKSKINLIYFFNNIFFFLFFLFLYFQIISWY